MLCETNYLYVDCYSGAHFYRVARLWSSPVLGDEHSSSLVYIVSGHSVERALNLESDLTWRPLLDLPWLFDLGESI